MYEILGLSKAYGPKQVLSGLNITLEEGAFYVLTGPSGSGKTTLLHILMGLVKPDAGTVPGNLRCSAVFQENRLLTGRTPVQNLLPVAPRGMTRETVADHLARILPRDCLNQPVETLSGGMQRRVAIARAMVAQSRIILMDEPFTGLDADTAETVMAYIMEHRQGRTLIIATHQLEPVEKYHPKRISL